MEPSISPNPEPPLTKHDVLRFLADLEHQEQFEVIFTPEFQEASGKRGPYIVWSYYSPKHTNPEALQFFYDDGWNNYGPDNDEYPYIICSWSDIEAFNRPFREW